MNIIWPQVNNLKNGDALDAQTLNEPIGQLASRTDYLKRRLGILDDNGVLSSVVLRGVRLSEDPLLAPSIGNVVFLHSEKGNDGLETFEFRKAQATMSLYDDFSAAESAFTVGILISGSKQSGDVLIYGKLDLGTTAGFKSALLQGGEAFRSGRYYLSANEPGKVTAHPNGPLIYVGTFHASGNDSDTDFPKGSFACVNPQFLDIGTSHVHRAYRLVARPAGALDGTDVIGHLPRESESALSSDSSGFSSPSLVFGGTWTSTNDVVYGFSLHTASWGSTYLTWTRDGKQAGTAAIPAPDVSVDLDNGLTVRVRLPEANSYGATASEKDWTWDPLTFPHAGRGWVNHDVEAVAYAGDIDEVASLGLSVSGSWPENGGAVTAIFPGYATTKAFADVPTEGSTVEIDGTTYRFTKSPAEDVQTDIQIAGTVDETLGNLAKRANGSETPKVFFRDTLLVVCDGTVTGGTRIEGVPAAGFNVIRVSGKSGSGRSPLTVFHTADFRLLGAPVTDHECFTKSTFGRLSAMVFAKDATSANNVLVLPGTRLTAVGYDFEPNAVYDYVMGLHQEVDYYFPPVPSQAAGLFVNGVEMESKALFPDNPTYAIGRKTLYWMEEEEGFLPWPDAATSRYSKVDPEDDKTMALHFSVGFQCATGPVTSLVPAPGSAVKLFTYGTNDPAHTGDLMIDARLDFGVDDNNIPGYCVAKQGRNGRLLGGPVVERVKAGPGIVVTQPQGCPAGQGTVTIGLEGDLSGKFEEIALENAKQEKLGLFPYVSLLGWNSAGNIPSAFTAMMRVPGNLEDKDYRLHIRSVVFGASSFSEASRQHAAGIQFEYNILPDYTGGHFSSLKSGLLVPDQPRSIAIPFGHRDDTRYWKYEAFDPFVVTTADGSHEVPDISIPAFGYPLPQVSEFSQVVPHIKPGYLVAIRLSRSANPDTAKYDSYTGALGFMSLEWTLVEG